MDFRPSKFQHDELHFHSAVKAISVDFISAKAFEFDPLNFEQIDHILGLLDDIEEFC